MNRSIHMTDRLEMPRCLEKLRLCLNPLITPTLNPLFTVLQTDEKTLITNIANAVAAERLSKTTRVLDVGGGKGWGRQVSEIEGIEYSVLDVLPAFDDGYVIQGDICKTNPHILDNTFDYVFSKDTFEHLLEPWLAAEEIVRVSKPGALIAITAPFSWRYHPSPVDTFRFSHTGLAWLFQRTGWATCWLSGYIHHAPILGFWGNGKDRTPDNLPFTECWEAFFIGFKTNGPIALAPGNPCGDYSTDHRGHIGKFTNRRVAACSSPQSDRAPYRGDYLSGLQRQFQRLKAFVRPSQPVDQKPAALTNVEPESLLYSQPKLVSLSHIAAYSPQGGNAGDILLPTALRDSVSIVSGGVGWTSVYARHKVTDETIEALNRTDGVIIGGGGLFLCDTNKNDLSGWQWPCPTDLLQQIRKPMCLMAVGYNRFRGQEDFSAAFRTSIGVLAEKSVFIGLRNRGSMDSLRRYVPAAQHHKIRFHPCLTTVLCKLYPALFQLRQTEPFIAFNCAFDRSALRYASNQLEILKMIAVGVGKLAAEFGLGLKYYAHMNSDEEMVDFSRKYIDFDVVDLSHHSCREIIDAYSTPVLVLGMRGHAQMIPFGCGTPILSLVSHDKLQWFLDDIGRPEWGVELRASEVDASILAKGAELIRSRDDVVDFISHKQEEIWDIACANMKEFLECVYG